MFIIPCMGRLIRKLMGYSAGTSSQPIPQFFFQDLSSLCPCCTEVLILNMVDVCALHVKWGFDGSFCETNPSFASSTPGLYKIFFFLAAHIHTQKMSCNIICLLEVLCNNRPKASQALFYKMLLHMLKCQSF